MRSASWIQTAVRRAIHLALVLFLVSAGTFSLLQFTPGDPALAILGNSATPEAVKEIDHQLGLDKPLLTQYGHWISHALTGNLGSSLVPPGGTVLSRIAQTLPVSLELTVLAVVMALLLAIPIGVWSAYREGGPFDRFFSGTSFGLLSTPGFVTGLVLALLFSLEVRAFPRSQWVRITSSQGIPSNLKHAFLPALTLALPLMAIYTRLLRADMVQTLREDYITFARSKGMPVRKVLLRYALRPSSISLITLSGVTLGALLGGTVIVETIYALPGMGQLLVTAVGDNDYPIVQGVVLIVAVSYVMLNLIVDVSYGFLDPRTRRGRR
jgi:peptide/nickel transport system permease protein